ncbi:MAG: NADH-quinone oxidoreductase subunit N [Campylobacterota bacterium]|nr:NADH-quinone oxidoreductase subunit N [Campylobacterota bacterium]
MLNDLILVLPMALTIIGAIVLMLLSFFKPLSIVNRSAITIAILSISFAIELFRLTDVETVYAFESIFGKMYVIDTFSTLFDLMFLAGAILTLLINSDYFKSRNYYDGEFFALLLFSVFGMMTLAHSNELISAFIALEIASLSIYALVGYNTSNHKSPEAMMKYIVLGSMTGAFYILGTALIYGAVGSTMIGDIYSYILAHPNEEMTLIIVGGLFIMITILFKIGAVPFHTWVVDVYHGAPLPVAMFMASTFKIALFAIALRIYLIDFEPINAIWSDALQVIAAITLIGGSFLALSQSNIKRMLAGSSIVHSGYLLIALCSIGLGADYAAPAIMFYLISYFLSSVGAFGILSFLTATEHKSLTFDDFKGFGFRRPYLAAMMTIFMLSLAGFPSTIGFLGKFYIFVSAIESGQIFLTSLGILTAFISIFYYFKLIAMMYFYKSVDDKQNFTFDVSTAVILLLAIMTIWGGIGTSLVPVIPGADNLIDIAKSAVESLH